MFFYTFISKKKEKFEKVWTINCSDDENDIQAMKKRKSCKNIPKQNFEKHLKTKLSSHSKNL